MKRLHGVKRNDLKKIASSSDNFINKTGKDVIEEELNKTVNLSIGTDVEDIQFDAPWETVDHDTDEQEYVDVHGEDEVHDVADADMQDGEEMPKEDENNIFDRLEHMQQDSSPKSSRNTNQIPPTRTPGHGFKPTATILQRKEDNPNGHVPTSRLTVPVGGKGGTSSKESAGKVKINIGGNKPVPPQNPSSSGQQTKPRTITVPAPAHVPSSKYAYSPDPDEHMEEERQENVQETRTQTNVPASAKSGQTIKSQKQTSSQKDVDRAEQGTNIHRVIGQVHIDDSKYVAVLNNFAQVIEKANETIENIIQYTQQLADAMAEATQDGSRELLNTTKDILAQLAANTHTSIHELNEASKRGHVELSKNTSKTLEKLTQKVDEYVSTVSQTNADVADRLSESTKILSDSIDKLSQYATSIVENSDAANRHMAASVQSAVQEMQKSALEYLHETTKSVEKAIESLERAHEKNAERAELKLNEASEKMVQTTEECIKRLFDAVEHMSEGVGTTIRKALDDYIRLRYKDQTHMIHMLQQHVVALQQQITNLSRTGVASAVVAPSTGANVSALPEVPTVGIVSFPAVPDSFMDPIIDLTEHECSYDVATVEKIVRDMAEVTVIDESTIYRVKEKMGLTWEPDPGLLDEIKTELVSKHSDLFSTISLDGENRERVRKVIHDTVATKSNTKKLNNDQQEILERLLFAQVAGIGKLQPLMDDPDVTEIMVVGEDKIFCIANGKQRLTDIKFQSKDEVKDLAVSIVNKIGRELNNDKPRCDAKLDNGTRVHAVIPPASANGDTIITMRKPPGATRPIGIKELVAVQSLSLDMVEFFKMCVEGRANIILYGETNSGKTTFIRAMANFFDPYERIITLEDTQELNLPNYHYVPLEAVKRSDEKRNIGIHDLFVDTLRMSPDRLIIGEVRGKEGGDLIEAFQSGQRGGMTTLHAGSPKQVVTRLVIMMSRAQLGISETIMRQMIHDSIDIVVQCRKLPDGTRKITRVTELIPLDEAERKGIPPFRDIFKFEQYEIKRDEKGKIVKIVGEHKYKAHLSSEKLTRYFEFGVDIPPKFGSVNTD